jgi:hypothetical protein
MEFWEVGQSDIGPEFAWGMDIDGCQHLHKFFTGLHPPNGGKIDEEISG